MTAVSAVDDPRNSRNAPLKSPEINGGKIEIKLLEKKNKNFQRAPRIGKESKRKKMKNLRDFGGKLGEGKKKILKTLEFIYKFIQHGKSGVYQG